jgi:multidrug efflux pump
VISHGAGAEMRQSLGLAVFSGMLGVTFFGVTLTPVFYYVIERFVGGGTAPPVSPSVVAQHDGAAVPATAIRPAPQ